MVSERWPPLREVFFLFSVPMFLICSTFIAGLGGGTGDCLGGGADGEEAIDDRSEEEKAADDEDVGNVRQMLRDIQVKSKQI